MTGAEKGRPAVLLLSGGLDSATAAAIALAEGLAPRPLTFRYGQRHAAETAAAHRVAAALGLPAPVVIDIDLARFGGSALTTGGIALPKGRSHAEIAEGGIPLTYVPARNTIFLAYALALAEVTGASDIVVGVNAVDYSGYPDCRPEFLDAFQRLANLATKAAVEGRPLHLVAPLLHWSKAQIIQRGHELGVDYALTVSCYDADDEGRACGACDSCRLRAKGFEQAGLSDVTRYRPGAARP